MEVPAIFITAHEEEIEHVRTLYGSVRTVLIKPRSLCQDDLPSFAAAQPDGSEPIPQMKKQKSGHVVNISGASVDQPSRGATELLAILSKSTMPAASKALALEYAANNIRFNTVSPAVVNTPMHAKANHADLAKVHPLGRIGEVSDVVG